MNPVNILSRLVCVIVSGIALLLHSEAGRAVLPTGLDVRQWLPGDAVFDATINVPDTLKSGSSVGEWAFWTYAPGSESFSWLSREGNPTAGTT